MSEAVAETRLKGAPLSPGIAVGSVCLYVRETRDRVQAPQADPQHEVLRLRQAFKWLGRQLETLARDAHAKVGRENAEIFRVHQLILADEDFQRRLLHAIEERGCTAETAVARELDFYRVQLSTADSEYLRQRASDIREIQLALLDHLNRVVPCRRCKDASHCSVDHCRLGNDHILVGEELSASLPIETDGHTVGFIVEKGGPNSHAVILARAQRRPAVGNIGDLPNSIPLDAQVLINGDTGEVILNPSAETLVRYQDQLSDDGRSLPSVDPVPELKVMANIERSTDVREALVAKAEGIGLYRTEMELLVEGRLLSEAEQRTRYSEVVRAMAGKPVCIRLLDFGADKAATCLQLPQQGGAMPELRGARLLLACTEILRDQARALARASRDGPIHVLYPMIVDVEQFRELRALFDEAVADLQPFELYHGVLFEVPSACLEARRILTAADFGCIGTNDLIQYLFAVDRCEGMESSNTRRETDALLWRLIEDLSRAAQAAGKPMTICGELAGNPDLSHRIIRAGITAVSTSPSRIARVRRAARSKPTYQ